MVPVFTFVDQAITAVVLSTCSTLGPCVIWGACAIAGAQRAMSAIAMTRTLLRMTIPGFIRVNLR
jgi:hypothetical protein